MNHTNFHMVCAQALQLILESLPHLFDFPGALVLAVLPNGAQVGLGTNFSRRPWRAAPRLERKSGSGEYKSMQLIPAASIRSINSLTVCLDFPTKPSQPMPIC